MLNGIENIQWPILFYLLIIPNLKNSFVGVINTVVGNQTMTFMVGHYWSLGVEEQFYAFWPWIVKKSKYLLQILIIFPIVFVLFHQHPDYSQYLSHFDYQDFHFQDYFLHSD